MRSFICKLVYWIMLKLYVFILWALLPLLTMGKGILIQNVVIFDGKSEKTVTGNVWIEDNAIRKVSAEPIVAGAEVEVIDGRFVDRSCFLYTAESRRGSREDSFAGFYDDPRCGGTGIRTEKGDR